MDFPEQLLGSSILVPLCPTPAPESRNSDLPSKGRLFPSKRSLAISGNSNASPMPLPPNLPQSPPPPSQSGSKESLTVKSSTVSRSKGLHWDSTLKAIRRELEKEKELYTMHSEAASRSFDRIGLLTQQLSDLIEEASHEPLPKISDLMSIPYPTIKRHAIHEDSSLKPVPSKHVNAHPNGHQSGSIGHASATVKAKYFPRKPRCLMFAEGEHNDLMITSSLDGTIQYTSMKSQSVVSNYFIPAIMQKSCYAETICAASSLNGVIVSTTDAYNSSALDEPGSSPSSLLFLHYDPAKDSRPILLQPASSPHQRSIGAMCSLFDRTGSASFRFATGGVDKNIAIWELDYMSRVKNVSELHRSHTAAIQALGQSVFDQDIIWSGGADCKLIGWSLHSGRSSFNHRFSSRIAHIQTNENHRDSLLLSFSSANNQLQLLDCRLPLTQRAILFGHQETCTTSRYMKPGWSPEGNLVAFGTSSPESRVSAINIWDLRYLASSRPVKSLEFGGEKRFLSCEFWPSGNTLVALATDNSANFVDYTTF